MDDCAESVETILQWLSSSQTSRHIDTAMNDLHSDLLAERPLLQYLRYNVQLDSHWLKENLDKIMTDQDVKKLQAMDQPENMPLLSDLGIQATERQIKDNHFPLGFDLGGWCGGTCQLTVNHPILIPNIGGD